MILSSSVRKLNVRNAWNGYSGVVRVVTTHSGSIHTAGISFADSGLRRRPSKSSPRGALRGRTTQASASGTCLFLVQLATGAQNRRRGAFDACCPCSVRPYSYGTKYVITGSLIMRVFIAMYDVLRSTWYSYIRTYLAPKLVKHVLENLKHLSSLFEPFRAFSSSFIIYSGV